MYRILVPIDTDERRAIAQARAIGDLPGDGGDLHADVLHVYEENPEGGSVQQIGAVRRFGERLDEAGIEYELLEASGDPTDQIRRFAEDLDVDLICLAGRRRSPAGKAVFGSVTQSVLLESERPVLCVTVEND